MFSMNSFITINPTIHGSAGYMTSVRQTSNPGVHANSSNEIALGKYSIARHKPTLDRGMFIG